MAQINPPSNAQNAANDTPQPTDIADWDAFWAEDAERLNTLAQNARDAGKCASIPESPPESVEDES